MATSSFFVDLTSPTPSLHEATKVIKHLIEAIGTDVCAFRRNTHVSYRFIDHARELLENINSLIVKVEDDLQWEDYIKYTEAIDPLEQALLAFLPEADSEHDQYLVDSKSVDACIGFIERWGKNREHIRTSLKSLKTQEELVKLVQASSDDDKNLEAAFSHDDHVFVRDLIAAIKDYQINKTSKTFSKKVRPIIQEVLHGAENIEMLLNGTSQPYPPKDESLVLSVKSFMIIYGVMELASNPALTSEVNLYLKTAEVWLLAKQLLVEISGHLKGKKTYDVAHDAYKAFLALLSKHNVVGLPDSYPSLIKNVGKIGRAYHAQALLLVSLCRAAASHFEKPENKNDKNFVALENAFDYTVKALESAIATVKSTATEAGIPSLTKFELDDFDEQDCTKLFKDSAKELSQCFKEIGLDTAQEDHEEKIRKAMEVDKQRMTQINEKIGKIQKPLEIDQSSLIAVTVKVCKEKHDGEELGSIEVRVSPSTRLSAIGWNVSRHSGVKDKITSTSSKFGQQLSENPQTMKPVTLDSEVGALSVERKCVLFMIV